MNRFAGNDAKRAAFEQLREAAIMAGRTAGFAEGAAFVKTHARSMDVPEAKASADITPTDGVETVDDMWNAAFETGRQQGFDEGILVTQARIAALSDRIDDPSASTAPVRQNSDLPLDAPIEDDRLNLGVRLCNMLKRDGIRTVADLTARSAESLFDIRNFGMKGLETVTQRLELYGYKLRPSPDSFWRYVNR